MDIYTITVPVLTTAHLTEDDVNRLEDEGDDKPIADYGPGLFMYVGGDFHREYYVGYSEAFYDLMRHLSANAVEWVRFDPYVGDELDDFPTFEW